MDIFMHHADDVADLETVYLPTPARYVTSEPDTLLDVTAVLCTSTSHTPPEISAATLASSRPPLTDAPACAGQETPLDLDAPTTIIKATDSTQIFYAMQTLRPSPSLLDTLLTIEHLCKLFLAQRGSPPMEISLHWLACLELLAYGHSSFCLPLPNASATDHRPAGRIVCVPFIASVSGSEHMILVRGR